MRALAACGLLALIAVASALVAPEHASATRGGQHHARAIQTTSDEQPPASPGESALASEVEGGPLVGPPSEGDFLTDNGLGSPACREEVAAPPSAQQDCATSGFAAAPAPTGDYAFDVHIDTGLAHLTNYFEASVQDAAQWGWLALVALVHGLIVMLEWCYSLNLLGGTLLGEAARALHGAQTTFTTPGLALVLAVASALVVYHGLVRRRVAQTLGQVLAMLAMMLAGLWTIADPAASVGALSNWANETSIGTLGAVAAGTPNRPGQTLTREMRSLFGDLVTGPWCYLEFGNVRWCRDPHLLDARLRKAALAIAGDERSFAASHSGAEQHALLGSATLLQRANDNGELFLALPANGAARNSINESGSLLSVLCGGSREATHCEGPSAEEAEFRTQHGTWPRVVGLLLIWIGALAALALFGWIGLRLLAAALLSLLLLLLAPAAVLAPALGEGGRVLFRTWGTRLIAAVTAKLVYSVLLGAALLMTNLLAALSALGWWAQWLLIAAGWWLVFHERHELLGLARVGDAAPWARRDPRGGRPHGTVRRTRERATHRLADAALARAGHMARRRLGPPPVTEQRQSLPLPERRRRARAIADKQVAATLEREHREASARIAQAPAAQSAISEKRARLRRVELARQGLEQGLEQHADPDGAAAKADSRTLALLDVRARRLEAQIAAEQGALVGAREVLADGARGDARGGRVFSDERLRQRARFYDEQAALPEKGRRDAAGRRRDYRRLAGLTGRGEGEWDELGAEERRRATLEIDDALASRVHLQRAEDGTESARVASGEQSRSTARTHSLRSRPARAPAGPARARTHPTSKLAGWLEEERKQAASARSPRTLAERARAEPGNPLSAEQLRAQEQLRRLRRQFGSRARGYDEE